MNRTFIIGDIHGCFDELLELVEKTGLTENDMLISVGDIVDRGSKSKEVYEYFRGRPNSKVLMGNHERKHLKGILNYAQEIVKLQFGEEYPAFIDWVKTLEYYHETEDAIVVHAAFEHDIALKDQREDVLAGTTSGDRYLENKYAPGTYWPAYYKGQKPVIFGHHVIGNYPEIINNTYGIDTAACHDGYLTAIELPGFIIHQVKSKKDYWKEEQKKWQVPVLEARDWHNMDFAAIQKQVQKLSRIAGKDTRAFLDKLSIRTKMLESRHPEIAEALSRLTSNLMEANGEAFNAEAGKYPFKTLLFKSRAGTLTLDDLRKSLNTPQKVMDILSALNLEAGFE